MWPRHAGVVDDDVDVAVIGGDLRGERLHPRTVGHVEPVARRLPPAGLAAHRRGFSAASALRPVHNTRAPRRARAIAVCWPMPLPAPVTNASAPSMLIPGHHATAHTPVAAAVRA